MVKKKHLSCEEYIFLNGLLVLFEVITKIIKVEKQLLSLNYAFLKKSQDFWNA